MSAPHGLLNFSILSGEEVSTHAARIPQVQYRCAFLVLHRCEGGKREFCAQNELENKTGQSPILDSNLRNKDAVFPSGDARISLE